MWLQICGTWYFPKFLINEGSFTQMNIASLMFLIFPSDSMCTMEKQSGQTGCPVVLGDGAEMFLYPDP